KAIAIEDGAASAKEVEKLKEISSAIAEGAMAFLKREYRLLSLFMVLFAIVIMLMDDPHTSIYDGIYTGISFLMGAIISIISGYIGMHIATIGNVRTAVGARISLE